MTTKLLFIYGVAFAALLLSVYNWDQTYQIKRKAKRVLNERKARFIDQIKIFREYDTSKADIEAFAVIFGISYEIADTFVRSADSPQEVWEYYSTHYSGRYLARP